LDNQTLFGHLKTLAESLGIRVREDAIESSRGGLFVLKGRRNLLINRDMPYGDKADLLLEALKKEDLSNVYVIPAVRDLLETK
jgi:hypothetical protein